MESTLSPERQNEKHFHKKLWCKFTRAINTYDLIQPGDKIAVCISGGKDSMLMAVLFQKLLRHSEIPFSAEFLVMDPGYSPEKLSLIKENANALSIPVRVFKTDIFDSVFTAEKSPCYLCARMRRGHLYDLAKQLGCNKIALGHHFNDVIETILMGLLYGSQIQTMMPKLHSAHYEGMELIRPLYMIREEDILLWRDYNSLSFLQCACRFTEETTGSNPEHLSRRKEIKQLIQTLKSTNPDIENHIFKSVENVSLDAVLGWKSKGARHSFLDAYDSLFDDKE